MPYPSRSPRRRSGHVWRSVVDPTRLPSVLTSNAPIHRDPLPADVEAQRRDVFQANVGRAFQLHAAQYASEHGVDVHAASLEERVDA